MRYSAYCSGNQEKRRFVANNHATDYAGELIINEDVRRSTSEGFCAEELALIQHGGAEVKEPEGGNKKLVAVHRQYAKARQDRTLRQCQIITCPSPSGDDLLFAAIPRFRLVQFSKVHLFHIDIIIVALRLVRCAIFRNKSPLSCMPIMQPHSNTVSCQCGTLRFERGICENIFDFNH